MIRMAQNSLAPSPRITLLGTERKTLPGFNPSPYFKMAPLPAKPRGNFHTIAMWGGGDAEGPVEAKKRKRKKPEGNYSGISGSVEGSCKHRLLNYGDYKDRR